MIYWSCSNRRTTPFLLAVFFATAKGENCQISFRDRQDKHCRSSQCAAIVILQKQAIFRSHRPLECVNYFRRSSLILLDANQPKDKPFRIRSSSASSSSFSSKNHLRRHETDNSKVCPNLPSVHHQSISNQSRNHSVGKSVLTPLKGNQEKIQTLLN